MDHSGSVNVNLTWSADLSFYSLIYYLYISIMQGFRNVCVQIICPIQILDTALRQDAFCNPIFQNVYVGKQNLNLILSIVRISWQLVYHQRHSTA